MKRKPEDIDPSCLILAEHFLVVRPVEMDGADESLANAIQTTVELWYTLFGPEPKRKTDADHEPEAAPG
jgi:hypothetical protein